MSDCIFCKIAKKEQKASIIFENDNFVAFKDINPKAPIHYLLIPKTHIESINSLEDQDLAGQLLLTAKKIAAKLEIKDSGYKLIFNVGRGGGQEVDHLHLHILGGWKN
jgi:histidine triad (HIT) family protein